jgi:hypothetical protein
VGTDDFLHIHATGIDYFGQSSRYRPFGSMIAIKVAGN